MTHAFNRISVEDQDMIRAVAKTIGAGLFMAEVQGLVKLPGGGDEGHTQEEIESKCVLVAEAMIQRLHAEGEEHAIARAVDSTDGLSQRA